MVFKMKREKIVRKIGDSLGIILNSEERKIHDIKKGDQVKIIIEKMRM